MKNRASDSEGFRQIYVPKDQILTEDQVFHNQSRQFKDEKKKGAAGYFYRAKSPDKKQIVPSAQGDKKDFKSLLSGLRAEDNSSYNKYIGAKDTDEEEDDEDVSKIVERKISMNQYN